MRKFRLGPQAAPAVDVRSHPLPPFLAWPIIMLLSLALWTLIYKGVSALVALFG